MKPNNLKKLRHEILSDMVLKDGTVLQLLFIKDGAKRELTITRVFEIGATQDVRADLTVENMDDLSNFFDEVNVYGG